MFGFLSEPLQRTPWMEHLPDYPTSPLVRRRNHHRHQRSTSISELYRNFGTDLTCPKSVLLRHYYPLNHRCQLPEGLVGSCSIWVPQSSVSARCIKWGDSRVSSVGHRFRDKEANVQSLSFYARDTLQSPLSGLGSVTKHDSPAAADISERGNTPLFRSVESRTSPDTLTSSLTT